MMKDEDIGTEGLVSFTDVLQFVNQLQDSDYDLYEEMEQVCFLSIYLSIHLSMLLCPCMYPSIHPSD